MSSNPQANVSLHEGGLYREEAAIAAVNVSCGRSQIGLLVQDAKGYTAIQLEPDEAAHISVLLNASVAKLRLGNSGAG